MWQKRDSQFLGNRKIWKINSILSQCYGLTVAPHAGAWIETTSMYRKKLSSTVAPHAGAWVETAHTRPRQTKTSLPTRKREERRFL